MKSYRNRILINIEKDTILSGAKEFEEILKKKLKENELDEEIQVLETGTLGVKTSGISMVICPENTCYENLKISDIDKIIEEHLLKGRIIEELTVDPVKKRLIEYGLNPMDEKLQNKIVLSHNGVINPEKIDEYVAVGGYDAIGKILKEKITPEQVVKIVKDSNLRGRGGAGFPTGVKWGFTLNTPAERKFVICNADEGEPGTFKDRLIMEGNPHRIIEGMIIAGYAVGASKGYIYIRGEYELSIKRFQIAIKQAYDYKLLGENILKSGFSFDIEIKKGAGAYVCGEETSLIESLEGKRGNPRIKPPFPGISGLWKYPTIVNNVETLANIAPIINNGAEWFKGFGTEKCPGTKVFTILGNVKYTGVVELPMGVTLREIIYGFGGGIEEGKEFKAVHLGGTAGAVYDESILDVSLDFDTLKEYDGMLGSGAVLVISNEVNMRDYLENVLLFFKHESCGQCSPCRIGTVKLYEMIKNIEKTDNKEKIMDSMIHLSDILFKTSLCPLGQSLIFPVKSIFKYFCSEINN